MNTDNVSTRRRFLCKAGAALSAPLAVAGANISASGAQDRTSIEARLADLEDVNAIRKLHRTYAALINRQAHDEVAGLFAVPSEARVDESIGSLSADPFGEDDVIELAPEGQSATGQFQCIVQTRTPIGPNCTLVEMARAQGEGFIERLQRHVVEAAYVKEASVWKIRRVRMMAT